MKKILFLILIEAICIGCHKYENLFVDDFVADTQMCFWGINMNTSGKEFLENVLAVHAQESITGMILPIRFVFNKDSVEIFSGAEYTYLPNGEYLHNDSIVYNYSIDGTLICQNEDASGYFELPCLFVVREEIIRGSRIVTSLSLMLSHVTLAQSKQILEIYKYYYGKPKDINVKTTLKHIYKVWEWNYSPKSIKFYVSDIDSPSVSVFIDYYNQYFRNDLTGEKGQLDTLHMQWDSIQRVKAKFLYDYYHKHRWDVSSVDSY